MSADESVIEALRVALAADPKAHAVRLHLAGLLVVGGDAEQALEHAGIVLAALPDKTEALAVAREAAQALGDRDRVAAYDRLLGISVAEVSEEGRDAVAVPEGEDGDPGADDRPELPRVTLADVGGMTRVKERLDLAFLAPLRNPRLRDYYGKSLRGGRRVLQ